MYKLYICKNYYIFALSKSACHKFNLNLNFIYILRFNTANGPYFGQSFLYGTSLKEIWIYDLRKLLVFI